MATLSDLYSYYCRRWDCRPNSAVLEYLDEEYARHDNQRILEEVDVSDNYLGKKGIIPVMDLVKNTKTVRRIDFSNNLLEHEQLEHLVYCLVLHPSIQSVILRNNCLHEGSLGHVIELLKRNPSIVELDLTGNDFLPASIVLLKELTMANREKTAKRVTEDEAIAKLRRDRELHPFQAEVNGSFTEENSGGYLHFATWWRNPQYRIAVSKTTRVCITMKIHDGIEARQSGFVVMRFDGIRRVVEVTKRTIIVESPVDCNRCVVETKLEEGAHYVIMPFTFHPGRTMQYTLGAKLIHDKVTLDEGWVTFDLLDERYDWCTNLVQREWEEKNSGGCGLHHTWRNNDMFRLRYTGPPIPYYNTSPATVCIILSKAIDSDLNDEKEIGLDVMEHDTYCQGKPPMLCTPDVVRTSRRHERVTSIFLKFSSHTSDLDLFLVPSTKEPNQHGRYSLAIFSTVPTEVETSHFPHRWNYRVLNGVWDDTCCGGCRELYKSWKNNPAVELVMEEGDGRTPITACLEMDQESYAQAHQQRLADDQAKACSVEEAFLDPEEAKVAEGNRAFTVKHRASLLEGCISVVDGAPPRYIERRTSALSSTEAQMTIIDTSAPFYFVPMARHAGQQGSYRLHLFCADPFVVASVETLALRERRAQLAQYEVENQARKTQQRGAASATTEASNGLQALHDLHVARNDILRSNLSSGAQFVDREFPRGTSSLWLAPEGRAPSYFPAEYTWVRAKEMGGPSTGCLRNGVLSPPFPYGRRHWLASVIQAVATKPHWLARLLVVYDEEAGFAQFRFFKTDAWVGVTIDDYLTRDAAGELCFGHSMDKQDYFYPLLEKAYAKLHRCYQALELPVTPELSLLDVLCQGMMDCSGGYAYVIPIRTEDAEEMEAEAKEAFWRTLKGATRSDLLFSLILRSDLPGASERQHVGLLSDHLYGVLDARFIEQQRLVKVRNWVDGQDATWKGQWAPHSDNWTPTLLEVLEYNHEQNEVWMSLDELLYYFSDVIVTEQHKHISLEMGDFPNTLQDPEECDERLRNPQYQLTIRDLPKDNSPVEIVIGLHQRDARLSVIRDKNAVAHYKVGLGLAVFGTADNMRRLKSVGDDEVAKLIAPQKRRDIFTLLTVDPTKLNATHYTIMPFRESLRERNTMYYVTARSAHATVEVTPVDHNTTITLDGAWEELTAGGPPELPTWRNNRQFFLYPSEIMEVAVRLMPTFNPSRAAPLSVGFSIHSTKRCNSFLFYEPDTVMLHVGPEAKPSVSGTVTLLGMKERRGMPYVIVPYVNEANSLSTYTLEVVANRKFTLLPIEPRLDWHRSIHNVHITTEDGSAGGSLGYPSWRCNPQFALTFPATREGRLFITAVNRATGDKHNPLGMALLRGDLSWDGGRRRKVTYEEADVIATTSDCLGRVDLDVELSLADTEAPVILVVYTTKPYREVDVEVSVYSAPEVEIAPVAEWKCVAIAENSWELGQTAGGSRSDFASWINNPFLALSTIRPTQIVALLIQYPRGPEKPIVKRYQNKKTFLPPPITNPNSRMAIELDLVNYDRELTSILHAGSSMDAEITLTASLEACTDHPFLMVPCTTIPEKNGDFKLIVYADHPIDLYGVEKPRLWYV